MAVFSTYLSRGLFKPRIIFARINGPNVTIRHILCIAVIFLLLPDEIVTSKMCSVLYQKTFVPLQQA